MKESDQQKNPPVCAGIDRVEEEDYRGLFEGKRLGLIAGASGLSSDYRSPIEVMRGAYDVRALFAPEHGARGVLAPGQKVTGGIDEISGLPVYSLFEDCVFSKDENEKNRAYMPSQSMLVGIDRIVFDMQDVGSRYFTYASTLFYVLKVCGRVGLPVTVLDRPNPIGGEIVEGGLQKEEFSSFIGLTRVPIRHGLTMGELARYQNGAYDLKCDLTVVPMTGWRRDMFYDETGLPFVCPSPNLPTMDAVTVYNGTCMLSGTNVSEGRGTTTPFTVIGAPYIQPVWLSDEMNALNLPGVRFSPAFFLPQFSKYQNEVCRGVRIHVLDRKAVRAVSLGVHLIRTLQRMYPHDFSCNPPPIGGRYHIDLSTGGGEVREGKIPVNELLSRWDTEAAAFQIATMPYRLY